MPSLSFAATKALSAFYDVNTKKVKFVCKLLIAGALSSQTKALTFFTKVGKEIVYSEVNSFDLQALITDKVDQKSIVYEMPVIANPPADLLFWVTEQTTDNEDIDLETDEPLKDSVIRLFAKPSRPVETIIINKDIITGSTDGTLKITGVLKFLLPPFDGGIALKRLNYNIIAGNKRFATNNYDLTDTDLRNGYVTRDLLVDNLKDGTALSVTFTVDNDGGEQSALSPALNITVTTKPIKPTFEVKSGVIDEDETVIPIKAVVDVNSGIWTTLHILEKLTSGANAGQYSVLKSVPRDTEKMDDQMKDNGFVAYNFTKLDSTVAIKPLTKYELYIALGTSVFAANGKASQSDISERKIAVSGLRKQNFLSKITSTSSGDGDAAKHTFSNEITGFTVPDGPDNGVPLQFGFAANLLQNGNKVDSKVFTVSSSDAVKNKVTPSFDLSSSLVLPADRFIITYEVLTHLTDSNAMFLTPNRTLHNKPALLIGQGTSKSVVSKPKVSQVDTSVRTKSVDDIKSAGGIRKLLVDFAIPKRTDEGLCQIKQIKVQVSEDPNVAPANLYALGSLSTDSKLPRTTETVDVSADGKNIAETIILTKHRKVTNAGVDSWVPDDIPSNTPVFIKVVAVVGWLGSEGQTFELPATIFDHRTDKVDSIPAIAALTLKQVNSNGVKVIFNKLTDSQSWAGDIGQGNLLYKAVSTLLTLHDELGREIATKIIPYESLGPAQLSHVFDVPDTQLDQFVTCTAIGKYRNTDGVVTVTDRSNSPETFLAKKLVFKSIQTIETPNKLKMVVALDFGRQASSEVSVKAVIPYIVNTGTAQSPVYENRSIADFVYNESEDRFIAEVTKQEDPQLVKYGAKALYYIFASGLNGILAATPYPAGKQ